MVSRTKYPADEIIVKSLFRAAGLGDASEITPLGKGEFSSVFSVKAEDPGASAVQEYAVKIAPPDDMKLMTLERDMMESELFWYEKIRAHTPITVPEVVFSDFSREIISAPWFIMEKLPGLTLDQLKDRQQEADRQIAEMTGHIHNIRGDGFGYIQNGLHSNWFEAIRAMTEAVLNDGVSVGRHSKRGKRLLDYIERHKDVLTKAECRMVNFDLWPANVICTDERSYAWIDPERSFWGDPAMDLVCLETMKPLEQKTISFEAHNSVSDVKLSATPEIKIRYGVALGYLGLIMETEKYFRYSPGYIGWWRNKLVSKILLDRAFKILEY